MDTAPALHFRTEKRLGPKYKAHSLTNFVNG